MANIREITEFEKRVFTYLNDLRDSGVTNMYGSPAYVQDAFGIEFKEASNLVGLWMENFNSEGNYLEIKY